MTIFDVLTMIGGLSLFLFGMNVMGDGLERRAGNSLERTADHCSNIAICTIDATAHTMNAHEAMRNMKENNPAFDRLFADYAQKYTLTR
ncbi:MAG: hypothetical protein IJO04_01615 [Oscillospiraceae bacterium]|nr:hypothetical protein [Oscillospiraceae bacterium]